ncbi:membrane protein [Rugosibacter aromaticivorans]|uniref:Probable membrane transporter protein n=1 Tax=Rugosibacter aromaticivorans TaxID=1565605 RepID=A0A0C5IXH0_9PROT|nr:sulfite exporter TauE/SafE family protein [Rugosibacter aromaticivorans]AJP47407.1 membrane protein [Rugosibacter aromaticivorans]TBR13858.1 MAG: sulfite exporter TauE/SafE family protein [Rugosibacter sp.]
MNWFFAYLALGVAAGFFAGLLGIGGGAVVVPILVMMFAAQGFPDAHLMHLVLGTSMATIIFTSISSMRTHHQHQAVNWSVVKTISPGIILGTLLGAQLAAHVPTRPLAIFFAVFMTYVAAQMIINAKPAPSRDLPGRLGMMGAGLGIGAISALAAVGGGSLTVPFLLWCNVKMHQAIGTSAAVGLPIALAGTLGYMLSGYGASGLPAGSFGFIYLPALAGTVLASAMVAPFGARLAHRLPVAILKKIFASVILLLLAKMLYGLFSR